MTIGVIVTSLKAILTVRLLEFFVPLLLVLEEPFGLYAFVSWPWARRGFVSVVESSFVAYRDDLSERSLFVQHDVESIGQAATASCALGTLRWH
jgi:hypothetical protein